MNEGGFRAWLDRYAEAWRSLEPDRAAGLFTRDARYHRTRLDPPLEGREAIVTAWARALWNQRDVHMQSTIVALQNDAGIARWRTAFRRPGNDRRVIVDGVLIADFSADFRAGRRFREWWHSTDHDGGRSTP